MKINQKNSKIQDRRKEEEIDIEIGTRIEILTEREIEREIERAWKGNNPEKGRIA